MEKITLLEVNKPEKVKEVLNELINHKNTAGEIPEINAEKLGLGNVDNTRDINKPLSVAQKTYVDNENQKNVKLESQSPQRINSDILMAETKKIYFERGDGTAQETIGIENEEGHETLNVGSLNIPLKLQHSKTDINGTIVSANPKVVVTDETGSVSEEELAFTSDIEAINDAKIDKETLANTGVVSSIFGKYFTDVTVDEMSLNIAVKNVLTGALISETALPLKIASNLSRGLMSKEDVITLNELVQRVTAMEGKGARYIYTESTTPTAEEIDVFVQNLGHSAPYTGIAIVVAKTYHVWHFYENDNVGWRDDGSDTVSKATNNSLGIVIGSNEAGKIYIESDGSMSVVGFDAILDRITMLENTSLTDIAIAGGTNNGTIKVTITKNGVATTTDNIAVTGLGSAAYSDSSTFALKSEVQSMIDSSVSDVIGGSY